VDHGTSRAQHVHFHSRSVRDRISAFFAMDVIVSAVVLFIFIKAEARKAGVTLLWLPIVGTLLVGVSFGLPLFLYLRQVQLDRTAA
jgi:hypothetical protein